MSELQKFENSEEWRNKLRNFLLREIPPQTSPKKEFTEMENYRYSFDVSEDLKKLIEEKRQKKKLKEPATNMADCENKENENDNRVTHKTEINANDLKLKCVENADETTFDFNEISDESFEAMEMMCNKTASDPDSTLFQYLHSKRKEEVVAEIKQRLSGNEPSQLDEAASESSERLLNDLRMKERKEVAEESILKVMEMTQIEDIEAPSRFWDNDTILHTSPVKMVGLLRPSTIFECAEISNASSTQASFKSAQRDPLSEISSSCYETASDTLSFYKPNKVKAEPNSRTSVNLIDLDKTIKTSVGKEESMWFEHNEKLKIQNENLIDLTIDNLNENSDESEESVIELLSDDENSKERTVPLMTFEDVNLSCSEATNNCTANNFCELDALSTSSASKEQSLNFNDTLEEVEYMMQKGLEFMTGAGLTPNKSPFKPKTLPSPQLKEVDYMMQKGSELVTGAGKTPNQVPFKPKTLPSQFLPQKQPTFTVSSAKSPSLTPKNKVTSASQARSAQQSASKCESRFALNIKPIPKLDLFNDLFKKPGSANKSANKPSSRQKDKFAHVVSPIGAYIKKSAEVPFMSAIKTGNNDKNSSVFRELDFDSRRLQSQFGKSEAKLPKSPIPRSLPKKAYISSEYKQVVDERNAITIPGGKSIQKYLDDALMPSVIQHDGKSNLACGTSSATKLPMTHRYGELRSHIPKRVEIENDSFADLSVVKGDVSLYTIKDAQKL